MSDFLMSEVTLLGVRRGIALPWSLKGETLGQINRQTLAQRGFCLALRMVFVIVQRGKKHIINSNLTIVFHMFLNSDLTSVFDM